MSDKFNNIALLKARAPGELPNVVATVYVWHALQLPGSDQPYRRLELYVRRIAVQENMQNVCNCLMHAFTNQV